MRPGRPKKPLDITKEEREKLRMVALRPKSSEAMALRAHRACLRQGPEQLRNGREVADHPRNRRQMAGTFSAASLDGPLDTPRVGAPRTIADRQVERVIARTLESMPAKATIRGGA